MMAHCVFEFDSHAPVTVLCLYLLLKSQLASIQLSGQSLTATLRFFKLSLQIVKPLLAHTQLLVELPGLLKLNKNIVQHYRTVYFHFSPRKEVNRL